MAAASSDGQATAVSDIADSSSTASMTTGSLFRQACDDGEFEEGLGFLMAASRLRPRYSRQQLAEASTVVQLSHGVAVPSLICLPSIVALSNVMQYSPLSSVFRGRRDVSVIHVPGFADGESLPSSAEAVVEAQAEAVRHAAGEAGFVLLGHSSGGWLAHALTSHLENTSGPFPAGVVLVDTYLPQSIVTLCRETDLIRMMFERGEELGLMDDRRLIAMGGYLRLFADWSPVSVETPTLYIQAAEPMSASRQESSDRRDWRPAWQAPHTLVVVPGNHFTMMEEHGDLVAEAINGWLATLANPGVTRR